MLAMKYCRKAIGTKPGPRNIEKGSRKGKVEGNMKGIIINIGMVRGKEMIPAARRSKTIILVSMQFGWR